MGVEQQDSNRKEGAGGAAGEASARGKESGRPLPRRRHPQRQEYSVRLVQLTTVVADGRGQVEIIMDTLRSGRKSASISQLS